MERQQEDGSNCLLLHIVPAYKIGGVELAAECAARESGGALRTHFLASIPGLPVPAPSEWITRSSYGQPLNPLAAIRVATQIRRLKPEVVAFSLWQSVVAFLVVRLLFPRLPLVLFLHNISDVHHADALSTRLMMFMCNAVWADSEQTILGRRAKHKPARAISMLLHRPRSSEKRSVCSAEPKFVSWSRLNKQKRVDRALRLIALIKERRPDVQYTIIGPDDGLLGSLRALAAELELHENVSFVGAQDRTFIELTARSCTFYLQLSDYEGQAMAVAEAMQLGIVPVVTPVGAIPDYCIDGENAIFVDNLNSAADRLRSLLEQPEVLTRMSEAARQQFATARSYGEDILDAAASLAHRSKSG
jgi:glycosyltransferase involved in cell wall biosynthesis